MALSTVGQNNGLIKFREQVAYDMLRSSRFDPYMGADSTSPIVRLPDLQSKGKQINVPLVTQMAGEGVGAGTLSGNEESLDNYGFPVWADWARNGIASPESEVTESSFDIPSTARSLLRGWGRRVVRDDIVDALLSIPTGAEQAARKTKPGNRVNGIRWQLPPNSTLPSTVVATSTQKNNWMDANYDRVLFGSAKGNYSAGSFSTSVANVDATSDKLSAAVIDLAKAIANETVSNSAGRPAITPWMLPELDEENFVMFVGSRAFRDLRNDPTMYQANRDARERENDPENMNPIFAGGALKWNGVVIKEIPEITTRLLLSGVGASSIDVEPFFLCGAGALAYALGQMPTPRTKVDTDYGFVNGWGIEARYGMGKMAKAPLGVSATVGTLVDWGMVTGFVAGVASA